GVLWLAALSSAIDFTEEVRPILESHCFGCHGEEKQKGKVRFDTLSTDLIEDRRAAETWQDALDAVQLGEMPPEDEAPLSSDERAVLVEWLESSLTAARAAHASNASGAVLRITTPCRICSGSRWTMQGICPLTHCRRMAFLIMVRPWECRRFN
ncbi:MAG: c-type cytochrome domain-containing protein, partial [Verrucomicrobiota bacterium]